MKSIQPTFFETILDQACTIQAIPAPTFHESRRSAYFLQQLTNLHLADVQMDTVGNVLARLPGSSGNRSLVISAHMDTVHPPDTPLTLRKSEDRITGPGIGDNALGLAALIGLVKMLRFHGKELPGDLWLVFNIAEEGLGDLRGMQAVVSRFGGSPLAYIVVEGLGLGTILHRGLGVERYRLSVHTPGGHSWIDFGQPSAIHELCTIVSRLSGLAIPRNPCTTWNAGVIRGGTSINTIAPEAALELDLRSEDRTALANLVSDVQSVVASIRRPGVQVSMELIGKRLAGEIPPYHPLVELARRVLEELNIEPRLDIASTDANLPLSCGYPAICIGVTHGNHAHTRDEYMLTGPVSQGMSQLFRLVTSAWSSLSG